MTTPAEKNRAKAVRRIAYSYSPTSAQLEARAQAELKFRKALQDRKTGKTQFAPYKPKRQRASKAPITLAKVNLL